MMRVLLNTNVILDLFLNRPEFVDDAAAPWKANEQGELAATENYSGLRLRVQAQK